MSERLTFAPCDGLSDYQRQGWLVMLSWEGWWAEGWIGPHVPPWTARTWPG